MSTQLKSKHRGFVLYEAIIALMVTILTVGILQQSLKILQMVQQTSYREQLRWHITEDKLQQMLSNYKAGEISEDKIELVDKQTNMPKRIIKVFNFQQLIITTEKGGYEPIITNLKKIRIEKNQNLVIITTVNKAGKISQMCLTNDS
ncbi:competence type IV pilus minor pilin ComGF [Companilactobacillus sp. FL22-1]|uniref:competence type IV pilus minor pilin ComGF n=1 Tax=Companilactobacillus sp. FL22-1 TaxID=3373892 RepID=UPI0037552C52